MSNLFEKLDIDQQYDLLNAMKHARNRLRCPYNKPCKQCWHQKDCHSLAVAIKILEQQLEVEIDFED